MKSKKSKFICKVCSDKIPCKLSLKREDFINDPLYCPFSRAALPAWKRVIE